ncbi:related to b mating type locus, bW1 allele [Ustilago trichophora]|uniref:Related to b mating type locus, bW1 allele n=1 Tax=Ustilago trichophora TaxID=86804 RepID=A0A5C3DPN8_9BASI|nr:related to b mating type locus, bW1 allele [Ustilago trichophora]
MYATAFLHHVHDLACQIDKVLPQVPESASRMMSQTTSAKAICPLELLMPNYEVLRRDLLVFNITSQCQKALIGLYQAQLSELTVAYQQKHRDAVGGLQRSGKSDKNFYTAFRDSLSRRFSLKAQELWQVIMQEVRSGTRYPNELMFTKEERYSDACSLTYSGEVDTRTGRGHNSDAVRILEQAFNHSPNITQAEKFQLAEVTGLKPKQVTIWFQNRRNRKAKKAPKQDPTTPPPTHTPSPHHTFTPSSPPTSDFTLSEKKRKSYGALGHTPADSIDSDSDSPSSHLKKPRLPRASSGVSDVSSSSIDYNGPFTAWSSPSSRSTSSSSDSSSPSDCFDSPTKAHNVFKYINSLKYDVRARATMPSVTIATPSQGFPQVMASGERSPFTSDHSNNTSGTFDGMHPQSGLNFGNLQLNTEALDRELRESIQRALELSASSQCSSRNVSSSSWGSQQMTTDDDGWVDEDDFSAASGGRHNTPVTGTLAHQPAVTLSNFNSAFHTQPATQPQPSISADTSLETSIDTDTFDLNQFFESATIPTSMPSSSPFVPHTHHSPQPPFSTTATTTPTSAAEMGGTCFDLECEMTDIQEYLNSNFITPSSTSLLSSQQSMADAGVGQGVGEGAEMVQESNGEIAGGVTAAQFALNFDLTSNMFSLL